MINRNSRYTADYTKRGTYPRNYSATPNTCSCERNEHNTRSTANCEEKKLKAELQKIDFSLYDTLLYLDIYPHCQKALAYYKKLLGEREQILARLREIGMPINNMSICADTWNWTESPWPWDLDANL